MRNNKYSNKNTCYANHNKDCDVNCNIHKSRAHPLQSQGDHGCVLETFRSIDDIEDNNSSEDFSFTSNTSYKYTKRGLNPTNFFSVNNCCDNSLDTGRNLRITSDFK